jgi:hypothetical protein
LRAFGDPWGGRGGGMRGNTGNRDTGGPPHDMRGGYGMKGYPGVYYGQAGPYNQNQGMGGHPPTFSAPLVRLPKTPAMVCRISYE